MDMSQPKPKRRWLKYTVRALLGSVIVAIGAFIWWGLTPLGPSDEARAALESTASVAVSHTNNTWVFMPKKTPPTTGYVFYPGGHVDARSYALYARDIAEQGYLVAIPEMPLSLAVFGIQRANSVMSSYPDISRWVVGGHSLGGSMAASFAASTTKVSGLVLLASYPPSTTNLSEAPLSVVSVYGSRDTVVNHAAIESSKKLLPATTHYVVLDGGNHAQFGSYGPQPGDAQPAMSAAAQRNAAVRSTVSVLSRK